MVMSVLFFSVPRQQSFTLPTPPILNYSRQNSIGQTFLYGAQPPVAGYPHAFYRPMQQPGWRTSLFSGMSDPSYQHAANLPIKNVGTPGSPNIMPATQNVPFSSQVEATNFGNTVEKVRKKLIVLLFIRNFQEVT